MLMVNACLFSKPVSRKSLIDHVTNNGFPIDLYMNSYICIWSKLTFKYDIDL